MAKRPSPRTHLRGECARGTMGQARWAVSEGFAEWSETEEPDEDADDAPVVTAKPKGVVALPVPEEAAAAAATTAATEDRLPVEPAANEREYESRRAASELGAGRWG
uniref:Uncharacterized protein n=1 Tax=Homalodisca liturata TaxID=320908 RepID=A0A1B6IK51_9HEMI